MVFQSVPHSIVYDRITYWGSSDLFGFLKTLVGMITAVGTCKLHG